MNRFKECVKNHFYFLNEFGYTVSEENSTDVISFIGKNNRIDVMFSTVEYELTCQFVSGDNQIFSLQDGLEYDKAKELFEKNIEKLSKSQLKKLELIRKHLLHDT